MKKIKYLVFIIFTFLFITSCVEQSTSTCDHTESSWIIDVNATCTTNGSKHTECTKCKETLQTETIKALGHNLVHHSKKESTCIEHGNDEYDTCTRCSYTTYKTLPLTEHTSSNWIIDVNATCTTNGSKHIECTICKLTLETKETEKTNHNYVNGVCEYCKESLLQITTDYVDNEYNNVITKWEAFKNKNEYSKVLVNSNDYYRQIINQFDIIKNTLLDENIIDEESSNQIINTTSTLVESSNTLLAMLENEEQQLFTLYQSINATWLSLKEQTENLTEKDIYVNKMQTISNLYIEVIEESGEYTTIQDEFNKLVKEVQKEYQEKVELSTYISSTLPTIESTWNTLKQTYDVTNYEENYNNLLNELKQASSKNIAIQKEEAIKNLIDEIKDSITPIDPVTEYKNTKLNEIKQTWQTTSTNYDVSLFEMQYKLTYIYEIENASTQDQIDSTLVTFDSFINSISEYNSYRNTNFEIYREKTREMMQLEWNAVEKYQSVMGSYVDLNEQAQMIYEGFYSGTTLDDIDNAIIEFKKLKEKVESYKSIKTTTFDKDIFYVTINSDVDTFINTNIISKKILVTFTDNSTKEIEITNNMIKTKPSFDKIGLTKIKIEHSFDDNLYNISLSILVSVKPNLTNATKLTDATVESDTIKSNFGSSVTIYDNGYLSFNNGKYDLFQSYTLFKENVYVISKLQDWEKELDIYDEYVVEVYSNNNEQKLRYYIPTETSLLTLSYYQSDMMINHTIEIFGTYTTSGKYVATHSHEVNEIKTTILVDLDMENKTIKCSFFPVKFIYSMIENCQTYLNIFEYDESNNITLSLNESKKKVKEMLTNSFNNLEHPNLDYFQTEFNQILAQIDEYQPIDLNDLSFELILNQYAEVYNKIICDYVENISVEGFSIESINFVNEGQNIEEYIKNNVITKRIVVKYAYSGYEYIDITLDKVTCYNYQEQTDDVTFIMEHNSYRIEIQYLNTPISIILFAMPE